MKIQEEKPIMLYQCLEYEAYSSPWMGKCGREWWKTLCSNYVAWKVERKYERYLIHKSIQKRLIRMN
jgi:hypothetical protein